MCVCCEKRHLFPTHVNEQLCAVGAEGNIGGHQDSQAVVVISEFHWQVAWSTEENVVVPTKLFGNFKYL